MVIRSSRTCPRWLTQFPASAVTALSALYLLLGRLAQEWFLRNYCVSVPPKDSFRILCRSSCFAPRGSDSVDEIAVFCKENGLGR
jgi:hypothetical protein